MLWINPRTILPLTLTGPYLHYHWISAWISLQTFLLTQLQNLSNATRDSHPRQALHLPAVVNSSFKTSPVTHCIRLAQSHPLRLLIDLINLIQSNTIPLIIAQKVPLCRPSMLPSFCYDPSSSLISLFVVNDTNRLQNSVLPRSIRLEPFPGLS